MVSLATENLTHVEVPQPRPSAADRIDHAQPNVGELERVVSIFAGSLLVARGLKKLSLPGLATAFAGYRLINRGATGQCSLYRALHVTTRNPTDGLINEKTFTHPLHQHIRVEKTVTINKPIEEIYNFWRNLENLPRFMDHLESVKVLDEKHSHWTAKAPRGQIVEWDATIVEEQPNKKIAWKSAENATVPNSGQVLFNPAPDGRGTEVKVILAYDPPAGIFGALFTKLFGEDPAMQVQEDLRHVKQLLEAGEIPTTTGQPKGSCNGRH